MRNLAWDGVSWRRLQITPVGSEPLSQGQTYKATAVLTQEVIVQRGLQGRRSVGPCQDTQGKCLERGTLRRSGSGS